MLCSVFSLGTGSHFCSGLSRTCYLRLKLAVILLPVFPHCWDLGGEALHSVYYFLEVASLAFLMHMKASTLLLKTEISKEMKEWQKELGTFRLVPQGLGQRDLHTAEDTKKPPAS